MYIDAIEKLLDALEANPYITVCHVGPKKVPEQKDSLLQQCCNYVMSVKTLPELKAILLPDVFESCLNLHHFHLKTHAVENIRPREGLKVVLQQPSRFRIKG